MVSKSPAFQLYVNDFLGDKYTMMMSAEQVGGYFLLLMHAWNESDCGLDDNEEELAFLSRMDERWLKHGLKVRNRFFEKDGRLYNKRLLAERRKQEEWSAKSSEGGKRSAEVRKQNAQNKPPLKQGATARLNTSTSSSFTSSSSLSTSDVKAIYRFYPKKMGKRNALNAIDNAAIRLEQEDMPVDEILNYLSKKTEAYRDSRIGNPKHPEYTPLPATWYNQDRYDDDIEPPYVPPENPQQAELRRAKEVE